MRRIDGREQGQYQACEMAPNWGTILNVLKPIGRALFIRVRVQLESALDLGVNQGLPPIGVLQPH